MKNGNLVIYREIDVLVKQKIYHQKRSTMNKRNKRRGIGWCTDYGDIPCAVFNDITKKIEQVENSRGVAYAYRNRVRYQKRKTVVPFE